MCFSLSLGWVCGGGGGGGGDGDGDGGGGSVGLFWCTGGGGFLHLSSSQSCLIYHTKLTIKLNAFLDIKI